MASYTFTTTDRQDEALERVWRQQNAKRVAAGAPPYRDVAAMLSAQFDEQVRDAETKMIQALKPEVAEAFAKANFAVQAQALALLQVPEA